MVAALPRDLLTCVVEELISIRPDRVTAARARLRADVWPSAEELALSVVGRLVCDRIR